MIDKARLEQKCSMWNNRPDRHQLDQLDAFARILVDYNQKVNLTAITDRRALRISISLTACSLPPSRKWQGRWWMWVRCRFPRHCDKNLQAGAGAYPDGANGASGWSF